MITHKQTWVIVFILLAGLCICGFFLINNRTTSKIDQNQIRDLKFQRDSIIIFNTKQSKLVEQAHKQKADSLIDYTKYFIKADSINKIIIYNEKKKLSLLTRAGRDRVRDSIFRANNLPNSPR